MPVEKIWNILRSLEPQLSLCLRQGYSWAKWQKDLLAGITVAIVALPLAMALATASGVSPDKGLYTAIVGGFLIAAFGGSHTQIGGPTAAFIVVVVDVIQRFGYDGLLLATFMAGIILVIASVLQFGSILKYIPHAVLVGFTAGLAVVIFTGQLREFLGLSIDQLPASFWGKWQSYGTHLSTFNSVTITVSLLSVLSIVALRYFLPKVPAFLIVVCSGTFLVWALGVPVDTIYSKFGPLPTHLPSPELPLFTLERLQELLPSAFIIAFLAGIESLLSAAVADEMTGKKHASNAELLGQGLANIVTPLFGGLPATASFTRTATNIRAGAQSPVAGLIQSALILALMVFLAPTAALVPLASLAAILVVVAFDMGNIKKLSFLLKTAPRGDRFVMVLTLGLTVFFDLSVAIQVGIVTSSLIFMRRMSQLTSVTATRGQAPTSPQLFATSSASPAGSTDGVSLGTTASLSEKSSLESSISSLIGSSLKGPGRSQPTRPSREKNPQKAFIALALGRPSRGARPPSPKVSLLPLPPSPPLLWAQPVGAPPAGSPDEAAPSAAPLPVAPPAISASSNVSGSLASKVDANLPMHALSEEAFLKEALPAGVSLCSIHGPVFFGAATQLQDVLDRSCKHSKICILNLKNVPMIDGTGLEVLTHFIERTQKHGTQVILSGLNVQPFEAIKRRGIKKLLSPQQMQPSLGQAIEASQRLLRGSKG